MPSRSIVVWLLMGVMLGCRALPNEEKKTEDDPKTAKVEDINVDSGGDPAAVIADILNADLGFVDEPPKVDYLLPNDFDGTLEGSNLAIKDLESLFGTSQTEESSTQRRKRDVSATQVSRDNPLYRYLYGLSENQPAQQQQITVSKTLQPTASGPDLSHNYRPYQQIPFRATATVQPVLVANKPVKLTDESAILAKLLAVLKMISNGKASSIPGSANFWQSFQSSQGGVTHAVDNYLNALGGKPGVANMLQKVYGIQGQFTDNQNFRRLIKPVIRLITVMRTSKGQPWHEFLQKVQAQQTSGSSNVLSVIRQQITQENKRQNQLIRKIRYFKRLMAANKCAAA